MWDLITLKVLAERRPEWEAGVVFAGAPRSGKSWLVHRICHGVVPSRVDKDHLYDVLTITIIACSALSELNLSNQLLPPPERNSPPPQNPI